MPLQFLAEGAEWQLPRPIFLDAHLKAIGRHALRETISQHTATTRQDALVKFQVATKSPQGPRGHRRAQTSQRRAVSYLDLLHAIRTKRVSTKAALLAEWQRDPNFLKRELVAWMRKGAEHAVARVWPSLAGA